MLFLVAALSILCAVAIGCGSDDDESSGNDATGGKSFIRFAFAPDPVWDYMKSSGLVEEMGAKAKIDVSQVVSFDEFALFAGGHADIVSTGSYETANFDAEGVETVTFGKYNMNKEQMFSGNPEYETTQDFDPDCKVGVQSTSGVFQIWAPLVEALDGRRMTEEPEEDSDIGIVIAEEAVLPTLIEQGEVCAAIYNPFSEEFVNDTRTGKLHPMYDGKSGSQLFAEEFAPGHDGVNSNMFVARKEWFDEHHKEVAFFLKLWQAGIDEWFKNRNEIVASDPAGWGVTQDGDLEFVQGLLEKWDFTNESPYLTEEWIENERKVFDFVKEAGIFPEDQYFPEHAVIDPKTGEVTATVGGKDE